MASDCVRVRFTTDSNIVFVSFGSVTEYNRDDEAEISRKEALRLAKAGKCEILAPERKTAAKKRAPVTR